MRSNPNLYRARFQPSILVIFFLRIGCAVSKKMVLDWSGEYLERVSTWAFTAAKGSTEIQHDKFMLMLHSLLSSSDLWLTVSYS